MKRDTTSGQKQGQGFVKLMRSPFAIELLRDPLAFVLLALIALRARWRSGFSADGLEIGEALIGDYKNCGMTRREYRTRVERLLKWELITFRATPKGTIAKLTSSAVFNINERPTGDENRPSKRPTLLPLKNNTERPAQRPADDQQTANRRPLTKNERRKEGKDDDTRAHALTRETGATQRANEKSSSSIWSSSLEEAKKDPIWPEFEAYCFSNGGSATLKGWNTWRPKQSANGAKPRLGSMKSNALLSLRRKLIDERNSGKLNDARRAETKQQLLEIKQILKGRGIEYPASL